MKKDKVNRTKPSLHFSNFVFLTVAGIINAVGVVLFLLPNGLYDGGFSGLSMLITQMTSLNMSIFLIILNFPMFIIGLKKLGVNFMIYSLYAIAVYSLFAFLFQSVFPIDYTNGSPIVENDLLLSAIFGGIISGIGSGLTIRKGGAMDGVEVLAVMFAKRMGMSVGVFVMSFNVIIYVLGGILTYSWTFALYSVVAYAVGLKAVDFIIDGLDKAKSAFIITTKGNDVADKLSQQFGRGVTVIEAQGHYSKSDKTVLYCVVNRFELNRLKDTVVEIDPQAFVVVNDVTDTLGSSLRYERFNKRNKPQQNLPQTPPQQPQNTPVEQQDSTQQGSEE